MWVSGLLSVLLSLPACVRIPLPDEGPKPALLELPVSGTDRSVVSQEIGVEPIFDSRRYQVYEWTADRAFFVTGSMIGVPVGGMTSRQAGRLLVEYDGEDRVKRVEFFKRSAADSGGELSGPDQLVELQAGATLVRALRLKRIPGLENARFLQVEGIVAPTEMRLADGGRRLLAVERGNDGWVVDLESETVIDHFDGVRTSNFWTMQPSAMRMTTNRDGDLLALTQLKNETRLWGISDAAGPGFEPRDHPAIPGFRDVAFTLGRDTLLGLSADEVVELDLGGGIVGRGGVAGLLGLRRSGFSLEKPISKGGPWIALKLQIPSIINPDVVAVFSHEGNGLALLDGRNDFARASAHLGYGLSPDGGRLLVNRISHLEIWDCREIVGFLSGSAQNPIEPLRIHLLPFTNDSEYWRKGHAPVAVSPGGRFVAAAGVCAVSIWEMETGRARALIGPVAVSFPEYTTDSRSDPGAWVMSVQSVAIDAEGRVTVVFFDPAEREVVTGTWQL